MEKLTVRELKALCTTLQLSTSGLKAELIDRLSTYLNICDQQPESTAQPNENYHRRVSFVHFRRRIRQPIEWLTSWFSNDDDEENAAGQNMFLRIMTGLSLVLGAIGGLHSLSQMYLYIWGESIEMYLPKKW